MAEPLASATAAPSGGKEPTTTELQKKAEVVASPGPPAIKYPGPLLATVLYFALLLAMFLVALDMVS